MKNLPKLSLRFVDEWAKQEAKVPKKVLIRGYSNFCEGYIFDVEGLYRQNVAFSEVSEVCDVCNSTHYPFSQ